MNSHDKRCGRCGRIVNEQALGSMGSTGKNSILACETCRKYWYSHYIAKLDKMRLDPTNWHKKWNEFYLDFLKGGNIKEIVQFT